MFDFVRMEQAAIEVMAGVRGFWLQSSWGPLPPDFNHWFKLWWHAGGHKRLPDFDRWVGPTLREIWRVEDPSDRHQDPLDYFGPRELGELMVKEYLVLGYHRFARTAYPGHDVERQIAAFHVQLFNRPAAATASRLVPLLES